MATEFSAIRTDSIEVVDSNGNTQYILDADGLVQINSSNAVAQNFTNEDAGSVTVTKSGTDATISFSHNLGTTPDQVLVTPTNTNAGNEDFYVSDKTDTEVELTYATDRTDTNDLSWDYYVAAK